MFQRDDLAPRAAGDAHDARRGGLPVQETLGTRARRRDVQIGAVGEALGTAVAMARARDLAVRKTALIQSKTEKIWNFGRHYCCFIVAPGTLRLSKNDISLMSGRDRKLRIEIRYLNLI